MPLIFAIATWGHRILITAIPLVRSHCLQRAACGGFHTQEARWESILYVTVQQLKL